MKSMKLHINKFLLFLMAGFLIVSSCEEDEKTYPRTRLFQPVLSNTEGLMAQNNTIIVNLGDMKSAVSYEITMSRDSFQTDTIYRFNVDTNYFVINESLIGEELLWNTIYQVGAKAIADDPQYNSLHSLIGSIRTDKFPSNQGVPGPFDVTDTRAKVFWTSAGQPITRIVVYAGPEVDERLTNPLLEFDVTDEDRDAEMKIIDGLNPETNYQVAIYSENDLRGWEVYTTKVALEFPGRTVIDLTAYEDTALVDTLPSIPDNSVVLLAGGITYTAGGHSFDKSVEIRSGYSFTQGLPIIDCSSNYNVIEGAQIESIVFNNIRFTGDYNGNYVFNTNVGGNVSIGEVRFESCEIHSLRGVFRMKDAGPGVLDRYTFMDCVIDSVRDYGIITVDRDDWQVNNILIENTTISRCRHLFTSRNNTSTVTITDCTINEAPENGRQMFRWRTGGQDVIETLTITNTIWSHGWAEGGGDDYSLDGYDGTINNAIITNTHATSNFSYGAGKDEIPGFPNFIYEGTIYDLWENPDALNFSIKDNSFIGRSTAGDPRWRTEF